MYMLYSSVTHSIILYNLVWATLPCMPSSFCRINFIEYASLKWDLQRISNEVNLERAAYNYVMLPILGRALSFPYELIIAASHR